jgi:integrase
MLRHGCGCKLVDDARDTRTIQDYLRHRSIQSDGTLYGSRERAICWVVAGLI